MIMFNVNIMCYYCWLLFSVDSDDSLLDNVRSYLESSRVNARLCAWICAQYW